jgi:hypothetical protein
MCSAWRVLASVLKLLCCFSSADEEMFKEDPENCFAEGDLRKYLNKNGKSRKKKAEKK